MQYIDLRTGEKVPAPEEYDPNLLREGERLGPDHIESLRESGEDEEVLRHLQMVGSPASYQASPDSEVILPDDPRFPWDKLTSTMRPAADGEQIRGAIYDHTPITSPPNVYTNWWWPFCSFNKRTVTGEPQGVKWNPPVCCGYYGNYYVRGKNNAIYRWSCGGYTGFHVGRYWVCPGYSYEKVDKRAWSDSNPPKDYPKYKCR